MMPISLSILLPFHLGRVIEIHGDIFVSNANKEICFISSPGNGLSCCCCQSEVRSPSPTLPGKWNEAADPNLNPMQAVETESVGNSRVCEALLRVEVQRVEKKEEEPRVHGDDVATDRPLESDCKNSSAQKDRDPLFIPIL